MRYIIFFFKSSIDNYLSLFYAKTMFVSVVLDPSSMDSAKALASVLIHFRFKKVQRACWEHSSLSKETLVLLKKEIDRVTDYYDIVRLYQYPVQECLCLTELSKKRWRRCLLKGTSMNFSDLK